MSRFAIDTNVFVAMARDDHPDYVAATSEVERRLNTGAVMVVPAHTLVESYSVLTRLPVPFRLSPADAFAFLEDVLTDAEIVDLDPAALLPLLQAAAAADVRGGRVHDMLIASAAAASGADVLLTFNTRDFASFGFGIATHEPTVGSDPF